MAKRVPSTEALVRILGKKKLLPVIWFILSRKVRHSLIPTKTDAARAREPCGGEVVGACCCQLFIVHQLQQECERFMAPLEGLPLPRPRTPCATVCPSALCPMSGGCQADSRLFAAPCLARSKAQADVGNVEMPTQRRRRTEKWSRKVELTQRYSCMHTLHVCCTGCAVAAADQAIPCAVTLIDTCTRTLTCCWLLDMHMRFSTHVWTRSCECSLRKCVRASQNCALA